MQIEKIISGGRDGAGRAALDAAIDGGVDHGGWIPKGVFTGDDLFPGGYHLTEIPSDAAPGANVLGADATVTFSHGPATGASQQTARLAQAHGKPCLHIDLDQTSPLAASGLTRRWMVDKTARILNIDGSIASEDPGIYAGTYRAVWGLLALDAIQNKPAADIKAFDLKIPRRKALIWPESLDELVEFLEHCLPFGHRAQISQMNEIQLADIHTRLGGWIQETFGLWRGNDKLLKSAETWTFRETTSPEVASWVVIRALASRLRRGYWFEVIK